MTDSWQALSSEVLQCTKCPLSKTRTKTVLGEGDPKSPLMFVGEGPGEQEDLSGRPFVGAAGQLLDKMLEAIGLTREKVYICNVVKCRPPQNRTPSPEEQGACIEYLRRQFLMVAPAIIVCLGATPSKAMLDPEIRITRERGKWQLRQGVWIMPTYHPAALLYDESKKQDSWKDLKQVKDKLVQLNLYDKMTGGGADGAD